MPMPPCRIDTPENGRAWCHDCERIHAGHILELSQGMTEKAVKWREARKAKPASQTKPKPLLRSLPLAKQCQYFGERLTHAEVKERQLAGCRSCNNTINVFHCKFPGQKKFNDGPYTRGAECMSCTDWSLENSKPATEIASHENRAGGAGISWPVKFDHNSLHPEIPGVRFNSSIIEGGDGYLYAFRNGWAGSRIYVCRLTGNFKPIDKAWSKLDLPTKGIKGHEDPRFFRLNGKLHLWYIAYGGRRTNVRFCRINEETLEVEDEFFPQIPNRNSWEKNHAYFDYQGIAHAVYSIKPHKIIRIEGNSAEFVADTPFKGNWSGGHLRGGASPVLHNGEWYHFFHGKWEYQRYRYSMGCYTFSPEPPFQILRYTPHPIDVADTDRKHDNYCDVIFPGGAIYKEGQWIIAHGVHDRWSEIRSYQAEWVERQLVKHAA